MGGLRCRWLVTLDDEQFGPAELACRLDELAGLMPAAGLRELRLYQARQLLEVGGCGPVAAVAKVADFAMAKHFSNLSTERFGRRPSD